MIYDSTRDIHVVVKTPTCVLLDTLACEVEVEDKLGRFTVAAGDAQLAALVPSEIVVRRRDGSACHIDVTWGSLTAVGHEVRIIVHAGAVSEVEALRMAV